MVAIIKKILGQRSLKKAGMETYGEKEVMQARAAERKAKRQEWIDAGKKAIKDYADKAPERRKARLDRLTDQAKIAEAEARIAKARSSKHKALGGSAPGFGMGSPRMGSPSMGMGVPSIGPAKPKPKKKHKKARQPRKVVYY